MKISKIYKKKVFVYLCCLFILFLLIVLLLLLPSKSKQRERAILTILNSYLNYNNEPEDLRNIPNWGNHLIKCDKNELFSIKETFIIYNKNYKTHGDWIAIIINKGMNPFKPDAYILKKNGKINAVSNIDEHLVNYSDLKYYIYH